jgi:uroporphyrinogen-III synthase
MKTVLTAGLEEERVKELTQEFKHSFFLRGRLKDILKERNESNRVRVRSTKAYEKPSWAFEQADAIGYERAIFEVISLISEESV